APITVPGPVLVRSSFSSLVSMDSFLPAGGYHAHSAVRSALRLLYTAARLDTAVIEGGSSLGTHRHRAPCRPDARIRGDADSARGRLSQISGRERARRLSPPADDARGRRSPPPPTLSW